MGEDVLSRVEWRMASRFARQIGPCLVWRDGELTIRGIYGWLYDPETNWTEPAHRVV